MWHELFVCFDRCREKNIVICAFARASINKIKHIRATTICINANCHSWWQNGMIFTCKRCTRPSNKHIHTQAHAHTEWRNENWILAMVAIFLPTIHIAHCRLFVLSYFCQFVIIVMITVACYTSYDVDSSKCKCVAVNRVINYDYDENADCTQIML